MSLRSWMTALTFVVLASSMKLEFPMSDALPNTEHARDRLLAKIFSYRKDDRMHHRMSEEDFALLYAFGNSPIRPWRPPYTDCLANLALVTGQISKEIDEVEAEIEKLFGVLHEDLLRLQ